MISAPARTPNMNEPKASIKTHGHLALLEWDQPVPETVAAPAKTYEKLVRKSALDRCYDGGTLALMAVTVAALAATLAQF